MDVFFNIILISKRINSSFYGSPSPYYSQFRYWIILSLGLILHPILHGHSVTPSNNQAHHQKPTRITKQTLNIAVASNFAPTLKKILHHYQQTHTPAHRINLITGSSGKHYAKILHGAPYDLFFSADAQKTKALIKQNKVAKKHVSTYAIGRIVLWANHPETVTRTLSAQLDYLRQNTQAKLSIANPKLAPYGTAAKQTLKSLKLWDTYQHQRKLIFGENINQSFHFVYSHAVAYGFIAYSQWLSIQHSKSQTPSQDYWLVPERYHDPILQQVALLKPSTESENLLQFIQSAKIQQLLRQQGYQTINNTVINSVLNPPSK